MFCPLLLITNFFFANSTPPKKTKKKQDLVWAVNLNLTVATFSELPQLVNPLISLFCQSINRQECQMFAGSSDMSNIFKN